jgi:hypothetical protein
VGPDLGIPALSRLVALRALAVRRPASKRHGARMYSHIRWVGVACIYHAWHPYMPGTCTHGTGDAC